MRSIEIAIVEDQPKLITLLKEKLSLFEELEIVWEAMNGKEAIDKLTNKKPDLVLMDIQMPVMDGIEATEKIKAQQPNVKIVMLTVFDQENFILQAILAGANGYLLKESDPGQLREAISEALDEGAPMSPSIAKKALKLIQQLGNKPEAKVDFGLSKRELEVLQELALGHNYQIIAEKLFISPKTVRKHIENIYKKLQVHNKVEAVQLAIKNQLV